MPSAQQLDVTSAPRVVRHGLVMAVAMIMLVVMMTVVVVFAPVVRTIVVVVVVFAPMVRTIVVVVPHTGNMASFLRRTSRDTVAMSHAECV